MYPLYYNSYNARDRIIIAVPNKSVMLILAKILGDIFGTQTKDPHISIQVVEVPAGAIVCDDGASVSASEHGDGGENMSASDWESWLNEGPDFKSSCSALNMI
jgi:hypothetical protein